MKAWSEIAKSSHLTTIGLSVRLAHTIISIKQEREEKKNKQKKPKQTSSILSSTQVQRTKNKYCKSIYND